MKNNWASYQGSASALLGVGAFFLGNQGTCNSRLFAPGQRLYYFAAGWERPARVDAIREAR